MINAADYLKRKIIETSLKNLWKSGQIQSI